MGGLNRSEDIFINIIDKMSFISSVNVFINQITFSDKFISKLLKINNKTNTQAKKKKKKKSRSRSRSRSTLTSKKTKNKKKDIAIKFTGKLKIASGNIDDGLSSFDKFTIELKKNFPQYDIKQSKIPNNLEFNKKYFEIPINFNLSK